MKKTEENSRRVFLHRLTFLGGGVVLLGGPGCKDSGDKQAPRGAPAPFVTSHRSFTNEEFAVLSAACERLLPRDDDPGALDAQVPEYIDRMLQTPELRQMREDFLAGLTALDRRARHAGKSFDQLGADQQDALLAAFKDSPPGTGEEHFYELLLALTMEGFLGDPSYGGNKDRVGWRLVGFDVAAPGPGYDGVKHLHDPTRGGGQGGCH